MPSLCVTGTAAGDAVARHAAAVAGLSQLDFTLWSTDPKDAAPPTPLIAIEDYEAIFVLEPPPHKLRVLGGVVTAWCRQGKTVVLAGPASHDPASIAAIEAAGESTGGSVLGLSLPAHSPVGRAVLTAAQQRSAGEPVYVRHAAEEGTPDALVWHLSGAVAFAVTALGEIRSLYVTAVRDARGVPVHLTALVRHADDCLSLVSIGASERPRMPSTLYLGNRGAVETNVVSGGVLIGGDDDPRGTGSFHRQRDDRLDALTTWLRAAGSLARGEGRPAAQQAARHMARVAGAASAVIETYA